MALIDLKTDLKSLKFGSAPAFDRPGGGLSGQPYIKEPIIDGDIVPQSEDFLLRGGLNAPLDAATDVARLTRYFADLKSPRGVLFVAKENTLSGIGVRTQASGVGLNEGIYTPLSTLAQATQGYLGGHLNKQGSNPFVGVTTYTDVRNIVIGAPDGVGNRLVDLTNEGIDQTNLSNVLYSYSGGPNSQLGIGQTNIFKASLEQRTGLNNPKLASTGFFSTTTGRSAAITSLGIIGAGTIAPSLSQRLTSLLGGFDAFKGGSYTTIDAKEKTNTSTSDFRQEIYKIRDQKVSYVASIAPSYSPKDGKTIDGPDGSRINYTSPGQKGNIISYTLGKRDNAGNPMGPVDKVNAQTIYQSSGPEGDKNINDLVKFRIAAINNEDPNLKQYIHFRAYIDSFSDAYGAAWSGIKYMGRGEEFYKYGGFTRDISLAFTVAAQSKEELMVQYKKLNFLASNLAPVYSSKGYMGGPLVTLTMGGWCYELPGFIQGFTLGVPEQSPWEIGILDTPTVNSGGNEKFVDSTVKEMPHIVTVTGFNFKPIHTFRPEKQINDYNGERNGNGLITKYGPQRYLSLKAVNDNYDDPIN